MTPTNQGNRDGGGRQKAGRGRSRGRRGGSRGRGSRATARPSPTAARGASSTTTGAGAPQQQRTTQRGRNYPRSGGGGGRIQQRGPQRAVQKRQNGEQGAEAHTVSEAFRIKLTNVLLSLRDDDSKTSLEFPSDLTNTERKFLHLLASQLGLKSKSHGKGEDRKITVSKVRASATVNTDEDALPTLEIGVEGERALQDHVSKFPPNPIEMAESQHTGSGLLENDAQELLLRHATVPIQPDLDYVSKPVNLQNRRRNHEASQQRKLQSKAYKTMEKSRSQLPAWSHRSAIVKAVAEHQVTIILGETGCGKSTQVPQFLLDANPDCFICVTQPRRIAAISIADRIATEQSDESLIAHQVRLETNVTATTQLVLCTPGVLLRKLQSSRTLEEYTHIVLDEVHERDRYQEFLLIILRDLLPLRPDLRLVLMSATLQTADIFQYFDSFHPATIEMEGRMYPVQEFFLEDALSMTGYVDGVAVALIDSKDDDAECTKMQCVLCGKTGFGSAEELGEHIAFCDGTMAASGDHDGPDQLLDAGGSDDKGLTGLDDMEFEAYDVEGVADNGSHSWRKDGANGANPALEQWDGDAAFDLSRPSEEPAGRADELLQQYQTMHDDETVDNFLLVELMQHIVKRGAGGILVFLPGWLEISELSAILESTMPFCNTSQYSILPLHSGIHSSDQKKVLQRPPGGVRKIVLATNIAETSLTIDDIVFVIDSGRSKEKNYDPHLKTSTLQTTWISKASAKQRKGRAGRVRSGICFHLFSKLRHEALRPFTESELLRTPLEEMCLVCKQLRLAPGGQDDSDGVPAFLAKAMNPPHEKSISNALDLLVDLGAMQSDSNELTTLGECLAVLSLEPRVGKMMIWSYLLGCARVAADMAVAMTTKSPFILPKESQRRNAENAKVQLSMNSESDQLTIHFALERKSHIRSRRDFAEFCRSSYINATTMQMISDLRRNLFRELNRLSFADPSKKDQLHNRHDREPALWQAAIIAGLYPNIASRTTDQTNFSTMDKHKVKIHVSSVNSAKGQRLGKKCTIKKGNMEFVTFGEIVKGDRLFTVNQTTHLTSPLPLLLLCGTQLCVRPKEDKNGESHKAVLCVDDWIRFECDATIAGQLVILRRRLDSAFWNTIANGFLDGLDELQMDAVKSLGTVLISAHRAYS